MFLIRMYDTV